jgi:hypothetical protein
LLHYASSTCPFMCESADIMSDDVSSGPLSWQEHRLAALLMLEKRAIEAESREDTQRAIRSARLLATYSVAHAQPATKPAVH